MNSHISGIKDVLDFILKRNIRSKSLDYFMKIAKNCMIKPKGEDHRIKVAIVGINFPEEIIYAYGAMPIWIVGGSHALSQFADKDVPRDTDPISKSSLGYLTCDGFISSKDIELVIIPANSDNIRKVASIISPHKNIFVLDIPSFNDDPNFEKKLMDQFEALHKILKKITKVEPNAKKLHNGIKIVNAAKYQMSRFLKVTRLLSDIFPATLIMTIINTYYLNPEIVEWIGNLDKLNHDLEVYANKINRNKYLSFERINCNRPKILLTGSPVYFPNMKIPMLIDSLNFALSTIDSEMILRISNMMYFSPHLRIFKKMFKSIILYHYYNDSSTAFIKNKNRMKYLKSMVKQRQIDGVIYHVLRGQISYDFELDTIENFFSKLEIPIVRIETDYNGQDIEQLRIRLEAFSEMLSNNYDLGREYV